MGSVHPSIWPCQRNIRNKSMTPRPPSVHETKLLSRMRNTFRFHRTPRPLQLKGCFGCFVQSLPPEGWQGQHDARGAILIRSTRTHQRAKALPPSPRSPRFLNISLYLLQGKASLRPALEVWSRPQTDATSGFFEQIDQARPGAEMGRIRA